MTKVTVVVPHLEGKEPIELVIQLEEREIECVDLILSCGSPSLTEDYNIGIGMVKTPYTLLMQADCLPSTQFQLTNLISYLEEHPDVVAVTSLVALSEPQWRTFSFWGKVLFGKFQGVIDQGISGKFDLVRTVTLQKIGGYDSERFKFAGDDIDLYLRLLREGKVVTSREIVIHKHDATRVTFRDVCRKRFHWGQSTGALFRKHGFSVLKARYASNFMHHINKWLTLSLPLCFVWPYLLPVYLTMFAVFDPTLLMFNIRYWPTLVVGNYAFYLCDLAGYIDGLVKGKQTSSAYK